MPSERLQGHVVPSLIPRLFTKFFLEKIINLIDFMQNGLLSFGFFDKEWRKDKFLKQGSESINSQEIVSLGFIATMTMSKGKRNNKKGDQKENSQENDFF